MTELEAIGWMNVASTGAVGSAIMSTMAPQTVVGYASTVGMMGLTLIGVVGMYRTGGNA